MRTTDLSATWARSPRDPRQDAARRLALLQSVLAGWVGDRGGDAAARRTLLLAAGDALASWPGLATADRGSNGLAALAHYLGTVHIGWPRPPDAAELAGPFARALVAQAVADVEFEASRAGHARTFAQLRPWLATTADVGELPVLAAGLGLTEAALTAALRRLRRRFRQRIDAGLALWSATPEQQRTLRHELHAALTGKETTR